VKREAAFWDASALVPLFVHEASSRFARQQARRFAVVVWWASSLEVFSAICRLRRTRNISEAEWQEGSARLAALRQSWREVLPGDDVRNSAKQLLERHPLRAGDSLQLAAALVWCGGRASKRVFLCGDQRLSEAAKAAGFAVIELPQASP